MAVGVERLLWASYGFTFSQNLKKIRRSRGVTQQALAEIAGLSRTQVCNLERNENNSGSSADPALSTVYKLALALEVPPSLLLPEAGQIVNSICTTAGTREAIRRIKAAQVDMEEPLMSGIDDLMPFASEYTENKRYEARMKRIDAVISAV